MVSRAPGHHPGRPVASLARQQEEKRRDDENHHRRNQRHGSHNVSVLFSHCFSHREYVPLRYEGADRQHADLEGIVAKRVADAYQPKLARWHKILTASRARRMVSRRCKMRRWLFFNWEINTSI